MRTIERCKALAEHTVLRSTIVVIVGHVLMQWRLSICQSSVCSIQFISIQATTVGCITVSTSPVLVVVPVGIAGCPRPNLVVRYYLQVDEQRTVAGINIITAGIWFLLEWQAQRVVIALTYIKVLGEMQAIESCG